MVGRGAVPHRLEVEGGPKVSGPIPRSVVSAYGARRIDLPPVRVCLIWYVCHRFYQTEEGIRVIEGKAG